MKRYPLVECDLSDLHNLKSLRKTCAAPDGQLFTWGRIIEIHHVGRYDIVEFQNDCSRLWPEDGRVRHGSLSFHSYLDGKDMHRGYPSLDAALAGCIAYAAEGPNTRADEYFMRSLTSSSSCDKLGT